MPAGSIHYICGITHLGALIKSAPRRIPHMERYNVRIALHGASPAIYDMLGDAMTRMGGASYVESASGRMRRLRPGEYVFNSQFDAHGFLRHMEKVVRAIWMDSGIRVTGEKDSCAAGVEPLPEALALDDTQRWYLASQSQT